MPIRRGKPLTFRARGLTDAIDGSNAFPGSMQILQDAIPNPTTAQQFVARPASTQLVFLGGSDPLLDNFGQPLRDNNGDILYAASGPFLNPGVPEALYVVGTRIFGMAPTNRFPGHSEPFCYDTKTSAFVTIGNVTSANTPLSQPTVGDWTPPTMDMIANKIIITHPGYDGITHFIGWIDMTGFTSATVTGNTHTSTAVDNLSTNVLAIGWSVGQLFAAAGVPAGTYITAIAANGLSLTLSQATTSTLTGTAITVSGGTTAAPLYGSGQVTGGFPFTAVPVAVAQFNGRAYYAVFNDVVLSDALQPLSITGAGGTFVPILTLGNSDPVTALVGVPLANQVVGGTIQSLIAFKGASLYWQIAGDPATQNLSTNEVNGSVGTLAPNSTAPTPLGIAYVAPDGLRFIGLNGQSSQPIGADGQGISVPFQYAVNPSRIAGAYNQNVYRVTVQNGFVNGQPLQEYWYDFNLQVWSGPHTFPVAIIQPIYAPSAIFVLAASNINGVLWESSVLPTASSSYIENGNQITPVWQPSLMPDNEAMCANSCPQGTIGLALPGGAQVQVLALDESGNILDSVNVQSTSMGGSVWGEFLWGQSSWGASVASFKQYTLKWHQPVVFKQATLRVVAQGETGFVIGNACLQYVELGYLGADAA